MIFYNVTMRIQLSLAFLAQRLVYSFRNLTKAPSVSAGIGVVYRSSILRLELNFCLPLIATNTDKLKKGLQLGLGFNFWWNKPKGVEYDIIYNKKKNHHIMYQNVY